jgi:hypothetical protein
MADPIAAGPDVLPYDPALPFSSRSNVYNRGCPPGTFCEWVPLNAPGAVDVGNPDYGVQCRSLASTTPDLLVSEAGWAWDIAVAEQSMDAYNAAVAESAHWPWWVWVALAVGGTYLLRGRGGDAPGWLGHRRIVTHG